MATVNDLIEKSVKNLETLIMTKVGELLSLVKFGDVNVYEIFQQQMIDDPEYAWSWHCNIAMFLYDNIKSLGHKQSNELAVVFMNHFFKCDTSKFSEYTDMFGDEESLRPHHIDYD